LRTLKPLAAVQVPAKLEELTNRRRELMLQVHPATQNQRGQKHQLNQHRKIYSAIKLPASLVLIFRIAHLGPRFHTLFYLSHHLWQNLS
jgi:hypothetical protein